MAVIAAKRPDVSIACACRAFEVSETCYRYSPLLRHENEEIADLLIGLTAAKKTWVLDCAFFIFVMSKAMAGTTRGFIVFIVSWS